MSRAVALREPNVIHFADDGKWPRRSDDPEWLALIEIAGGADACASATAKLDNGRWTTDEVFAELDEDG